MKQFISQKIETALNQFLQLDPFSKKNIQKLSGKVIAVELQGSALIFQLHFLDESIHIKWHDLATADTVIKGTPLSLLNLALTSDNRKNFFIEDISIEGNLDLAQDFMDLIDEIEIDWEEYLSRWIGDIPAHQTGRIVRATKRFKQRVSKVLLNNTTEYLHEESDIFPANEEIKDFFEDVDLVRMDVDRLAIRVQHIKKML